jgi:hypothetical protein
MSRRWVVIALLGASLIVVGLWVWYSSPVLRYHVLGDPAAFSQAFETLKRGDTMEHVCDVLGDRYAEPEGERSIREGFRGLAKAYPKEFPVGYRDSDAVLAYSADGTTRLGILFRDGQIIAFCSQRGKFPK